jgi:hypothetical protein
MELANSRLGKVGGERGETAECPADDALARGAITTCYCTVL